MPEKADYMKIERNEHNEQYVHCGDEVRVVPLTGSGHVILSIEPSPAFGDQVLLIGGGQIEPNEAYTDTANRELQEELGYKAKRLDFLGELHPWSKYLATRSFVYLARDLVESKLEGDEKVKIEQETIPLSDFETLIVSGQLSDAPTIAALYMARSFLNRSALNDKG